MKARTLMFKNKKASPTMTQLLATAVVIVMLGVSWLAGVQQALADELGNTTDVTNQVSNDGGNIAWEAPTIVPMKATATGTLIGPSADALSIRNLSAFPIRVKTMDVQAVDPFHLVADVDKSSGENDFQMSVNGVAAAPSVELVDDGAWAMGYTGNADGTDALPLTLSGAKIARVTEDLAATKKAATITWTVEPTIKPEPKPDPNGVAFAVYSADDQSLDFYKRDRKPDVGDTLNGKEATAVYTGIETDTYTSQSDVPWSDYKSSITSSTVVDDGIATVSTAYWFFGCSKLATLDLSKLDTNNVTDMGFMFCNCSSITSVGDLSGWNTSKVTNMGFMFAGGGNTKMKLKNIGDLSNWDTSNVTSMFCMFQNCSSLTSIGDLSGWNTGNVTDMSFMFQNCFSLTSLNLSGWNTSKVTDMGNMFGDCSKLQEVTFGENWKWVGAIGYLPTPSSIYITGADGKWYDIDGNGYAPADIPSNKAMTYTAVNPKTAFAVYSADDNSLSFYKRVGMPSASDTFNGKEATAVYTGFETNMYNSDSRVPWNGYAANIASVDVVDVGISPAACAYWFYGCGKMISCDVSKLDTSKATDMTGMFVGCSSIATLNVSKLDTSNVTKMTDMFGGCSSITTLDASGWNTSKAKDMCLMFNECEKLQEISFGSAWNTSNVTNMRSMFEGCSSITTLDVSGWNTSNVTNMYSMFLNCKSLVALNASDWNTSNVTNMSWMFCNCESLTALDLSSFNTGNVANMECMFNGCGALATLDLSSFNTGNVANMECMFNGCGALTTLDVSGFDTSKVTNMSFMFSNCSSLTTLDVSKLDTSSVANMECMFSGCSSLTTLDVSKLETSSVANMKCMFSNCSSLTTLDVSGWNTSNVTGMSSMFFGCSSIATLDLSAWDTSNVTGMSFTFEGCSSLATLDVSGWNTSKVTDRSMGNTFRGCTKLQEITFGSTWKWVGTNGFLPAPSSSYIAGADGKWHAKSDGAAYASKDIPSCKADTYYAVMPVAPKQAFAVYSADDNSLNFYKRAAVPAEGSTFEGKTTTAVYTGIDKDSYSSSSIPWKGYASDIASVDVVDGDISPVSCGSWFYGCGKMSFCDVSKLDTSEMTSMRFMFYNCKSLTSNDISHLDTSKVGDMSYMFEGCSSLVTLNVSGWNTTNVTNMRDMFSSCSSLTSLDVSSFDTSNVEDMSGMFSGCSSLEAIDLTNTSTRRVASMSSFLSGCDSLAELSIGSEFAWVGDDCYPPAGDWKQGSTGTDYSASNIPANKTDKYTRVKTACAVYSADDGSLTFYKRPNVPAKGAQYFGKTATDVFTGFESTANNVPWSAYQSNVETVIVADDGIAPVSTSMWFMGMTALKSADMSKLDTSNVANMPYMFYGCVALKTLDLSSFDTRNVKSMKWMFYNCTALASLSLHSFDTRNVTDMISMFNGCGSLTSFSECLLH